MTAVLQLVRDLRRWGWREVVYSYETSLLCRAFRWHTAACRGRRDHDPRAYREHAWPAWPPAPPYLLIDRHGVPWQQWIRRRLGV